MTTPPSKKITAYLQNEELQFVLAKAKKLAELNQKIATYLDPHLRLHCQVANLERGRLVLLAANGAAATYLRFQSAELLKQFQQDPALQSIREIHCIVRPPLTSAATPGTQMKPLSPQAAQSVKEIAQSLDDPRLRKIMEKIAGHVAGSKLPPK